MGSRKRKHVRMKRCRSHCGTHIAYIMDCESQRKKFWQETVGFLPQLLLLLTAAANCGKTSIISGLPACSESLAASKFRPFGCNRVLYSAGLHDTTAIQQLENILCWDCTIVLQPLAAIMRYKIYGLKLRQDIWDDAYDVSCQLILSPCGVFLHGYLSICRLAWMAACVCSCLCISLRFWWSVLLSVCLSVCLFVCLFVCV